MYSGYINVNASHGRNLFYWLVESANSPSTDPLVLWTNGEYKTTPSIRIFPTLLKTSPTNSLSPSPPPIHFTLRRPWLQLSLRRPLQRVWPLLPQPRWHPVPHP
jgi:hypothetical protein